MALYIVNFSSNRHKDHDGVYLAQNEISKMLLEAWGKLMIIKMDEIIKAPHVLSNLKSDDTLYCNADPYAYFLFLAREEVNGKFRIVRNIQTGPWNGYLLQESLCMPLSRTNDIVLHISQYTFNLYTQNFYKNGFCCQHFVCYPEIYNYPKLRTGKLNRKKDFKAIYLGRLSYDKGIDVVFEVFKRLYEYKKTTSIIVGNPHPLDFQEKEFLELINNLKEFGIQYIPAQDHKQIFQYIYRAEVLIFPSVSNVESLGRVIYESTFCHTPVVSVTHAETAKLIPAKNLVSPNYITNKKFELFNHLPIGKPNSSDLTKKILDNPIVSDYRIIEERRAHNNILKELLRSNTFVYPNSGNNECVDEVNRFKILDLDEYTYSQSIANIKLIRENLVSLISNCSEAQKVLEVLLQKTLFHKRTNMFIDSYLKNNFRLSNIGGFPIEACHLIGFNPKLEIEIN